MKHRSDKRSRAIKEPESSRAASTEVNPLSDDPVGVHGRVRPLSSTVRSTREAKNDVARGADSCPPADLICGRRRFRRHRQDWFFSKILGDCGSVKMWFHRLVVDLIRRKACLAVPPVRGNAKRNLMAETP
jgi:hypothetical protein